MSERQGPEDGGRGGRPGLDPAGEPDRWERSVEAIVSAAEPELRRRAAGGSAVGSQLERWARPVIAAAAALIVAGAGVLTVSDRARDGRRDPLAAAGPGSRTATLVSPVVDPWIGRDSLTVEAVEEIVAASPGALEDLR